MASLDFLLYRGYNKPYMGRAKLIFHSKHINPSGELIEIKGWAAPKSSRTPEGYKYSLVYIDASGRRVLGYDNAEGKGHHRHALETEESVEFESLEKLVERFLEEVKGLRGEKP